MRSCACLISINPSFSYKKNVWSHTSSTSFYIFTCRAAFTFADNKLGVAAKGVDFAEFKSHFGADDRGFGYIKITVRKKYLCCRLHIKAVSCLYLTFTHLSLR